MGRRNATTEFLKDCIADALLMILREKPLERITIQEVTDKAAVGRVTYYRNFHSKEEVIGYKLNRLMNQWEEEHPEQSTSANEMAISFFRFYYSIRDVVHTLMSRNLSDLVLTQLVEKMTTSGSETTTDFYRQIFLSFGLCGIIQTWIMSGMNETPEVMGKMLAEITEA